MIELDSKDLSGNSTCDLFISHSASPSPLSFAFVIISSHVFPFMECHRLPQWLLYEVSILANCKVTHHKKFCSIIPCMAFFWNWCCFSLEASPYLFHFILLCMLLNIVLAGNSSRRSFRGTRADTPSLTSFWRVRAMVSKSPSSFSSAGTPHPKNHFSIFLFVFSF